MSRSAWILDGFDRETEELIEDIEVPITEEDVRRMLDLPPDEDVIGGAYIVPPSALERFERVLGRRLRKDLLYQIGCLEIGPFPAP